MRQFMVIFMKKDLWFHEYQRVYADTHSEAAKAVRDHYSRGVVTILSVRVIKEEY